MQFKELESGLRQKFTDNRIVFWHDPEQRFTDSLNELDLDNVVLLDMRGISVLATKKRLEIDEPGLAPIFPYTFYHLTHYWFAAADIPVANDTPVHYADAIRCNVRRPPQGSLPLLTRRVSA